MNMSKEVKLNSATQGDSRDKWNIEGDEVKLHEAISSLRTLVSGEKNLKVRMDDNFMLRYLRATEYRPKEAFEKMVKVYKFKAKNEEYFSNKSPLEYKEILSQNFFTMLEDRDKFGRRLFLNKLDKVDVDKITLLHCSRVNDMWMEPALDEEETQKKGMVLIADMGGLPMRILKFLTPKFTIKCALKEEMRPWVSMDIHVVNTSSLINVVMRIVFPFLSSKFKQHIHFHGQDWASLHKFIPPEVLPQEYGGHKSQVDYEKNRQYLYDNEEKILELLSLGYVKS